MAFARKTSTEIRLLVFDFASKVVSGATLSNPTVMCVAVTAGTGVVGDITLGTAAVADLTVTALGTGGIDGSRYRLQAEVDASNGEHLSIERDLPVSDASDVVA